MEQYQLHLCQLHFLNSFCSQLNHPRNTVLLFQERLESIDY